MKRSAGILMPISALPSPYGIGTLGKSAKQFVDFLVSTKQSYWQILPLGQTGYGDSPYASFSSYAGNPYFIDLDDLVKRGYLKKEEFSSIKWYRKVDSIDYELLYQNRYKVLHYTVNRVLKKSKEDFESFIQSEKDWLLDYALFMVIKDLHHGGALETWKEPYKKRDKKILQAIKDEYHEEIVFYEVIQYLFFLQWNELKRYANKKGIQIIGDLPIYVARDSVEVWASPKVFQLDEDLNAKKVAGVPPDGFTEDGQLWGNPLYDWKYLKRTKYAWWIKRIHHQLKFYDVLRLDHFRGFESYFAIDAKEDTARNGWWEKGPGIDFFHQVKKQLGSINMIVEDLGYLTPGVKKLLRESKYPGIKVLEFAFYEGSMKNEYLPHNYKKNCVAYIGTHDNETLVGWLKGLSKEPMKFAKEYYKVTKKDELYEVMMKSVFHSKAELVVIQMQDYLKLDNRARMNTPSTLGGNWMWRMKPNALTETVKKEVQRYTIVGNRERLK